MRSSNPFPINIEYGLLNIIESFWKDGIFDDYSDNHFFIRAINNDVSYFKSLFINKNIRNIDPASFSWNFLVNFNTRANQLLKHFDNKSIKDFFKNQFAAGKDTYSENQFFEALSEFYILAYFATYGPAKISDAIYEPTLVESDKNPEARYIYANDTILDVEIKTPNFPERNLLENVIIPTYLLTKNGRDMLEKYCNEINISCRFPRVLKIKDFMNYAGDKFSEITSENHINLLIVNWSANDLHEAELFEPTTLLCNPINGIFSSKDVALKLGITENALNKVSAVLFYILPEECLLFNDFRYLFATKKYRIIVNPFAKNVNPDKIHELTRMAVHLPSELEDQRFAFFNLANKDWSKQLSKISEIIMNNTFQ